jgi:hypothetical protein
VCVCKCVNVCVYFVCFCALFACTCILYRFCFNGLLLFAYANALPLHTYAYMYTYTALQSEELQENVKVNIAVSLGRLAIVDTLEVAALADEFFADWCR